MTFLILPILIAIGVFVYYRSVNSRKFYRCPECGEKVRAELGEASQCAMCGTPLETEHPTE